MWLCAISLWWRLFSQSWAHFSKIFTSDTRVVTVVSVSVNFSTLNLCAFIILFHRGIEWVSLTSFLSFATSAPNNIGLVRNELQHVDLPTGKTHINIHTHTHCNISFFPIPLGANQHSYITVLDVSVFA